MALAEVQPPSVDELEERCRRQEEAVAGLFEISQVLTSPTGIEVALAPVMDCLESHFHMTRCFAVLLDPEAKPKFMVGSNRIGFTPPDYFQRIAKPIVQRIVAIRKPVVIADEDAAGMCETCTRHASERPCSIIGVPILEHDRVIGTLTAERCWSETGPDTIERDVRSLTMVAKLVGQTSHLQTLVTRDRERLMEENRLAEKKLASDDPSKIRLGIDGIVGESEAVQSVLRKIHIVAKSHLPVLLRGESGTGKELFAQAVHDLSPRREGPMVKLNCAALPETMLESELFGHEKGSFTGAMAQRKGRFELADGGTLFLDEIGEISASFQAKLLRVLQEGEFERVGGSDTIKVDVRLVAATNRNLEEAVRNGEFRSDLYFRLCVVPIILAPLRDRPEDIPLLAVEFLKRYNQMHGTALSFGDDALALMRNCSYPGNIRELESCVRRTAAFAVNACIHAEDYSCKNDACLSSLLSKGRVELKPHMPDFTPLPIARTGPVPDPADESTESVPNGSEHIVPFEARGDEPLSGEHKRLVEAMEKAGWVQAKAARLLGLTSRQMCYALKKHGVEIKHF
jgi:Nif-specific regulatory protein